MGASVIPNKDLDGYDIVKIAAFSDAVNFRFRGHSMAGTVLAGQTSNIDYEFAEDRYINGGRLLVSAIGDDDQVSFSVVDVNNILGNGAGYVADEFIKDFYIPKNETLEVKLAYPAKIIAGLFLRLTYKNTSLSTSTVRANLYLHWKTA